ncbi:MAG TPA: ATP-dependent sacrificial sulfur transferase LarE [Gemmatimonadaceae bacterium]|nr:ATP-dependent sacrificial sulfur transferase LarE [Gemmatimonadaceae bacterium]
MTRRAHFHLREAPDYVSFMMQASIPHIDPAQARAKEAQLVQWLRAQPSVLLGFSGGVDSAYLGCVAVDAMGPERVLAVIGRSPSYPAEQWATARNVAERFGLPVLELDTYEMSDPNYLANPTNRCFFCKTELWTRLDALAQERGIAVIIDGTNADDRSDYRPGAQAAREHGVRSPLAELGITKAEIRELSRERGIPTWAQPSSPCLSSRIPYGTAITSERLRQVEIAERALRELGVVGDLRVRHHGDLARIELSRDELSAWLIPAHRARIREAVRTAGFARVAIDLRGFRSGSLNVLGGVRPA